MEKLVTIYSIVFDDRHSCTGSIWCFEDCDDAKAFAKTRTLYSQPASVNEEQVPERIARRWQIVRAR